jgi:hypothetical protein
LYESPSGTSVKHRGNDSPSVSPYAQFGGRLQPQQRDAELALDLFDELELDERELLLELDELDALLDELDGKLIKFLEVVRGVDSNTLATH